MKNALLLLSALFLAGTTASFAQLPAGPEANPNKRMDCPTSGDIRNDAGTCVPIESYLSTGSNKIYWVDQRGGDNSNPGTKSMPWKTIQRANRSGQLSAGDAVVVRGGVYREVIRPTVSGKSGARITYTAYPGENVVISGATKANDGWTVHSGNIYKRPFTTALDVDCPWTDCSSLSWRRELLIVNGNLMTQVASTSALNRPGQFFVDGFPPDTPPKWMYARFPGDKAPGGFNIEVGREESLFLPEGSQIRTCKGDKAFYRIIGFTFRHAVNARQAGAVCSGSRGLLFEENTIEGTNALGINVAGSDHVLRGNLVVNNGQSGIEGGCTDCLIEYNESSANNWRLHPRGYNGGGGKFSNTQGTVIRHHVAKDNLGRGLWLDNSNYNNVIENSFFINNQVAGLHLEYKSNYNLIRNNVFYGTKWEGWTGSGLLSHAANNNTIVHNSFIANEGIGLWIRFNNREPDGYNKIYNNLFIGNATTADVNTAYEIALVTETNELNGNIYWSHEGLPGPTFQYSAKGWVGNDIQTWRSLTGGDSKAQVVKPSTTLIEDITSYNGWRLAANSIAIGKSAALPSAIEKVITDIEMDPRSSLGADVGADEYFAGSDDTDVVATGDIGEAGSVSVSQSDGNQWHKVALLNSYTKPVVTMGPLSANGSHPSTVRVRNVTSTSFEFQIDEWNYLDGGHGNETAGYLVIEAGVHVLGDGRIVQAGHAAAGAKNTSVSFPSPFSSSPVVLSQVGTVNHSNAVITRQSDVSGRGFSLALQSEEAASVPGNETVGWIAIDTGTGSTGGKRYEARATSNEVAASWYGISLQQAFSSKPAIVASMQTMNGVEPAALRHRNASTSGFDIRVEEEQSLDSEVRHAPESIGYVAFEPGSITAATESFTKEDRSVGESGTITVRQSDESEWHRLNFEGSYINPIVVISQLSYDGSQPTSVRVRNVTSTGCEFQVDEWDYLDGAHASETLGYVIIEAGTHTLGDGRVVQADHIVAGTDKRTVSFAQSFSSMPVVVSQITTAQDPRAAVTRQTDISANAFTVFLQPQESVSSHGDETVAWIATSAGKGSTGGRRYEAGRTGTVVSDSWHGLSFVHDYSSSPVVIASMQTVNGLDVAGLRMRNHSASGISVSLEEEQSSDKETRHTAENVGYMAFAAGPIETGSTAMATAKMEAAEETASQEAIFSAGSDVPQEFALHGNYPNPFNPQTTIRYDLPEDVHVQLEVFDVVGRRVALLADQVQVAGVHEAHFNAAELPSGLYLFRLKAGSFVQTGRMILLK